jgi:hypothetical protein
MTSLSEFIEQVLEEIDTSNMYKNYFSRNGEEINYIFTSHRDIMKNIKRDWIDLPSYYYTISCKIFDSCNSILSRDYIYDIISKKAAVIMLFPSKDKNGDFYGFLYSTLSKDQNSIYLDILCQNGSFLITLLICIAKYMDIQYIFLQSTPKAVKFYSKFLFQIMDNYKGPISDYSKKVLDFEKADINNVAMFLDMNFYDENKIELLKKRKIN